MEALPKTLYVPTDDGWALAMHHWPARGDKRRHPILMVHGFAANRLHFDLDERYSFARAARNRGFDVYILELRGAGLSRAPGGRDRVLFQWGFGDYAERDLPTAVATVLERSGAPSLHGVGHSMGGMLFYAIGTQSRAELKSIVAIGSPLVHQLDLGPNERRLLQVAMTITPESANSRVPLRKLLEVSGYFISLGTRLADGILFNAANVEPTIMARMAREAIADIPLKLVLELTHHMAGQNGTNSPYEYENNLSAIRVPVLAIGGSVDRVARPTSVTAAVARLVSADVRYREMGTAYGDRTDYGHVDLLTGRNAPEEVYPILLDFLEEVD